jgi:hypothetical protein
MLSAVERELKRQHLTQVAVGSFAAGLVTATVLLWWLVA